MPEQMPDQPMPDKPTPELTGSIISLAVQESSELRLLGYREALGSDPQIQIFDGTVEAALADPSVHLLLIGAHGTESIFDRIAEVRRNRPDIRILVASSHGDDESIVRCIQAGAKGYLDEACSIPELLQAIHVVANGSIWAPRRLLSMFIDRVLSAPPGSFSPGKVEFTPREREVLELLVAGYSNREIARRMGIEERTVKAHVAKLLRKVGVPNRIALTMHTIHHALLATP
jgi:DNA-binding NarL/FixJ family response regulator